MMTYRDAGAGGDGSAVRMLEVCPIGVERITNTAWTRRCDFSLSSYTLATLRQLGPKRSNCSCVCQTVESCTPIHIATPLTIKSLIGQI